MDRVSTGVLLGWASAVGIGAVVARNPLYLTIIFISCVATALSLRISFGEARWLVGAWLVLGTMSALFNFLTVRAGDAVIFSMPPILPVLGGPYTLNAFVYGLLLGQVFACLSLAYWVFWKKASLIEVYRLVPSRLHGLGVALTLGLTLVPGLVSSVQQVVDAQTLRLGNAKKRSSYVRLVVPLIGITLDRSLQLAEAMECRGFGVRYKEGRWASLGLAFGLTGAVSAAYVTTLAGQWIGYSMLLGSLLVLGASLLTLDDINEFFRGLKGLPAQDRVMLASAFLMAAAFLAAAVARVPSLDYYPYPRLSPPAFDPWIGIVSMMPAIPAVARLVRSW